LNPDIFGFEENLSSAKDSAFVTVLTLFKAHMAFLDEILERKRAEIAAAKKIRDLDTLKRMVVDAPPLRSFSGSLSNGFGLIAEIKRRSPSGGDMRRENVERAPAAYEKSPVVKCVSVLTNSTDFGMGIEDLSAMRRQIPKPILRKDFILEEYQVYETRAFGADGLLLMANVLDKDAMRRLFNLTRELGMDALFEAHTKEEIESIPNGAKLYGINSRKFKASTQTFAKSAKGSDFTVELDTFSLINHLPKDAIKIAESGVSPAQLPEVINIGYDAVLVGTSLLKAEDGIEEMLKRFESAVAGKAPATNTCPS
jgi:indole-3-glycerol phosphate synthase